MKHYLVYYTFSACLSVDAESWDRAIKQVEEKTTDELMDYARDGFDICNVEEE